MHWKKKKPRSFYENLKTRPKEVSSGEEERDYSHRRLKPAVSSSLSRLLPLLSQIWNNENWGQKEDCSHLLIFSMAWNEDERRRPL